MVRSEEKLTQNHYRRRQIQAETTDHEWMWITTLPSQAFPPKVIRRLGHDRWKQENNGWNDLTQNWAFKHGFLHACRHRPHAPVDSQPSGPVDEVAPAAPNTAAPNTAPKQRYHLIPNRGLPVVALIMMIAFNLCAAFTHCHSKLVRHFHLTGIEVADNCVCRCPSCHVESALPILRRLRRPQSEPALRP